VVIPHDLRDPQIKQIGFCMSKQSKAKQTPTARRPSAWAARGLASRTRIAKDGPDDPDILVYDNIAGILRASLETGLFLMA